MHDTHKHIHTISYSFIKCHMNSPKMSTIDQIFLDECVYLFRFCAHKIVFWASQILRNSFFLIVIYFDGTSAKPPMQLPTHTHTYTFHITVRNLNQIYVQIVLQFDEHWQYDKNHNSCVFILNGFFFVKFTILTFCFYIYPMKCIEKKEERTTWMVILSNWKLWSWFHWRTMSLSAFSHPYAYHHQLNAIDMLKMTFKRT